MAHSSTRTRSTPRWRSPRSPGTSSPRPPGWRSPRAAEPGAELASRAVRLFLAGLIPDSVKQTLQAQLEPVRAATPQARWLPPESLHLTLLFLGSVGEETVPPLREAFGGVCGRHRAL